MDSGPRLTRRDVVRASVMGALVIACGDSDDVSDLASPTPVSASPSPAPPPPPTPAATPAPLPDPTTEPPAEPTAEPLPPPVMTGADLLVAQGFAPLAGRRVGLIANQVSVSGGRHMIDHLSSAPDVDLVAVFAPEHGVRGVAGAGEDVGDTIDPDTGIPVISLYKPGAGFRPSAAELAGIDTLVFDLQDVGTRFYTYITNLGRCMEAAAEQGISFVVLDRPNPSGGEKVGGFTRVAGQESAISEYPIPSLYGLTAGELARMIVGEGYKSVSGLDLTIVPLQGWSRDMTFDRTGIEWIAPSPGLPTVESALIYPGTVLIEATSLSFGRGTLRPFTHVGAPWVDAASVVADLNGRGLAGVRFESTTFTPQVIPDVAENPDAIPFLGQTVPAVQVLLTDAAVFQPVAAGVHLLQAFRAQAQQAGVGELIDRPPTFDLLAGTPQLRQMITADSPAEQIVAAWAADVEGFRSRSATYHVY